MSLCFSSSSGEATRMTFFEFKVCSSLFLRLRRVTVSLRRHVRPPCSRRVRRASAEEKFMSSACSPPLPSVHQLEPSSGWFIHSESSDSSRLCRNTTQKKTNPKTNKHSACSDLLDSKTKTQSKNIQNRWMEVLVTFSNPHSSAELSNKQINL